MCELLGGSLTGMTATGFGRRFGNGMLSFYIDPKVVDPEDMFPADVARYITFFKSSKPAEAGGEILVPGEPERRMRAERSAKGIPLPEDTWASIVAAARELGVDENRIQQAGAAYDPLTVAPCRRQGHPGARHRDPSINGSAPHAGHRLDTQGGQAPV